MFGLDFLFQPEPIIWVQQRIGYGGYPAIVKYGQVTLESFPSGHVSTVTVLWGLLWARERVGGSMKKPLLLSALLPAALLMTGCEEGVDYYGEWDTYGNETVAYNEFEEGFAEFGTFDWDTDNDGLLDENEDDSGVIEEDEYEAWAGWL